MRSVYIYALKDPRNNKLRYIGKSVALLKRYFQHLKDSGDTRKARWIRKLLSLGLKPDVISLEICDNNNWQEKEKFWIAHYKKDLFNHTPGGEGVTEWEEESLLKLSESNKNRFKNPTYYEWYVKEVANNPERCRKISSALKGKSKSSEHILRLPQNQKGYKHKPGFSKKISEATKKRYREGYILPEASREKLRNMMLGNKYGIGNKSRTGQKQSEEEKRKKSKTLKGRKFSEHTLRKMSEARFAYWRRKKGEQNEPSLPKEL